MKAWVAIFRMHVTVGYTVEETMEEQLGAERDWRGAMRSLRTAHDWRRMRVEGTLPIDLCGTLYRNGPGSMDMDGPEPSPIRHWFDGVGAISGVRFSDGQACGAVRSVAPPSLAREVEGIRGSWGFRAPPPRWWDRLRRESRNAANTHVVPWQGRLFALYEGNLPTELDPETLQTLKETDLDGVIPHCFTAHPHRVEARRTLYSFGVRWALRPMLDVFALPDIGPAERLCSIPLDGLPLIHDFAATEKHLIFFIPPVRLDRLRQLVGLGTPADNLHWKPELGTEVLIVPIDQPAAVRRFTIDPFWVWHPANAFENPDGTITVDLVRYEDFSTMEWLDGILGDQLEVAAAGYPHRITLDPVAGVAKDQRLSSARCEFPRIDPRLEGAAHRYIWMAAHSTEASAGRGIQDRVIRVDAQTGAEDWVDLGAQTFCSEPVLAAREGGGTWVMSLAYDVQQDASFVAVIDGERPEDGPLARVWFEQPIPYTFHGSFLPAGG
jgi:all-trans-8'-apo-beta-carotenal 15,15'-oxygenase